MAVGLFERSVLPLWSLYLVIVLADERSLCPSGVPPIFIGRRTRAYRVRKYEWHYHMLVAVKLQMFGLGLQGNHIGMAMQLVRRRK